MSILEQNVRIVVFAIDKLVNASVSPATMVLHVNGLNVPMTAIDAACVIQRNISQNMRM
jgi:hypothetical protein